MENLIKIREVSLKYDISARTLRYYEDMGLISSIRSEDYAYRMYDEDSVKRLEQILILRKLNISIKDIQRIFQSADSSMVLEVLSKKAENIDEEVALLHELKEIVLQFIRRIEGLNFGDASDIKFLYEEAKEIERRLSIPSPVSNSLDNTWEEPSEKKPMNTLTDNPLNNKGDNFSEESSLINAPSTDISYDSSSIGSRLLEVTEKLVRGPEVRIIELPRCRMATSGLDAFDNVMGVFDNWWIEYDKKRKGISFSPLDFLWFEEDKCVWWMAVENDATREDTGGYDIIDFEGGLYAAAISVDGDDDISGRVYEGIKKWVENSGFELDERPGHRTMCHMIITDNIKQGLGYNQLDIYVPIKLRNTNN